MRKIHEIVIHCTGTREDRPYPVEQLRKDHLARGFRDIGYHYYITRDGTVHQTRPVEQAGAHVYGHNRHSLGICYEGGLNREGLPEDTRTPEQRASMHGLVHTLLKRFRHVRICGHRDLSPDRNGNGVVEPNEWSKQCPCFDVAREL